MVLGIFTNRNYAERAILDLESAGYNPKDLSIIMRDQPEADDLADSTGSNVATGAVSGMTTGGVVGGIAGLLIGMGAIAIPGLGGLLVGGPLAAALGFTGAAATTVSGAVTGALAGGLIGSLMGLGLPESDAVAYEQQIRDGAILLAVPDLGKRDEVIDILEENSAQNIRIINDLSERSMDGAIRPQYRQNDDSQYYYAGAKGGEVVEEKRSAWESFKDRLKGKRRHR
jgi:hypothetical protein